MSPAHGDRQYWHGDESESATPNQWGNLLLGPPSDVVAVPTPLEIAAAPPATGGCNMAARNSPLPALSAWVWIAAAWLGRFSSTM